MRRDQLEHAIRAATEILRCDAVLVVGSQAILGSYDDDELPEAATRSIEVDVVPLDDDDRETLATALDGAIGELSAFQEAHGFYVQGVGRRTAILPSGWEERLVRLRSTATNGRSGLCLDRHDLCLAKLVAYRAKDHEFVTALLDAGLVDHAVLRARVDDLDRATPKQRTAVADWLDAYETHNGR